MGGIMSLINYKLHVKIFQEKTNNTCFSHATAISTEKQILCKILKPQ